MLVPGPRPISAESLLPLLRPRNLYFYKCLQINLIFGKREKLVCGKSMDWEESEDTGIILGSATTEPANSLSLSSPACRLK